jgi:hypothetical protein
MHSDYLEVTLQFVHQHFMPLFLHENCFMHCELILIALDKSIDPESVYLLSCFAHKVNGIIGCDRISLRLATQAEFN